MSGFFSSQRPIESPRDHRTTVKRKSLPLPLQERSQSENNQQSPRTSPAKSTVRLVKPTPGTTLAGRGSEEDDENACGKYENREDEIEQVLDSSAILNQASAAGPGFAALKPGLHVSGAPTPTYEAQDFTRPDSDTLLSATSIHAVPKTQWHRRSGSSGTFSDTSTLKESESVFGRKRVRSESRVSQGTTLRGTPTPQEQDHRERAEAERLVRQEPAPSLHTVEETSPDHSTVRIVLPTTDSESSDRQSTPDNSVLIARPRSNSDQRPPIPRRSSRRTSSSSSLPAPLNIRKASASPSPRSQASQESIAQSEATLPRSSSPNFIAYTSSPDRPRSQSQPLQATASYESIQSRLQYPTIVRPETGRSLTTSSSWASLQPSSSTDTLPPLQVPKKRLRHKAASSSLQAAAAEGKSMADEDYDTEPYPRHQFSSHLSTIASESDAQSRATSQHLSHFSLGSGVLTIDDASSIPLSGSWPRRRRESAPVSSMASEVSPMAPGSSSEEDAGDMTMGTFRETSAKPQPLFQPKPSGAAGSSRKYDGPLPPVPPIPKSRDSDENFDRVSELQAPPLREKRSGYSLRRRSNSTPSRGHSKHMSQVSYSESDRWSHASSLFPVWAKNFYGNGAALMSASKISLSAPHTPQRDGGQHTRNDSQWTERSITSRLGTGYSEIESASPTSSHFLPSIFRPRTRGRGQEGGNKLRKARRGRPSGDADRSDSLAIHSDPLPNPDGTNVLPSGHPKYGSLRDGSEQRRALPRKYSKQRQWNDMEFPRPMTKDRLSDFSMHDPRLVPSRRNDQNRLSTWRAPSFVESLDTLVRSRCNRQILLFAIGFVCPLCWMLASVLPIPKKPVSATEFETSLGGSEDDIQAAMMKHEAGDAEKRFKEERQWLKARWWRYLNRVMSVIGILVIGAVIALAIVATT